MGEAWASVKGRGDRTALAAAAFVAGVTLCAAAPRFTGVAGEVAAALVR